MDVLDYRGKQVLVVGGSSGIGNGIARAFRRAGAQVGVWGTRVSVDDYADEPGSELDGLYYAQVDVTDRAALDAARLPDHLHAVVLCQGIVRYGREEFERDGWDAVVATNLTSLMDCARHVKPALQAAGGSLVIVSSVAGFAGQIGNPAYAASKAGAVSLTKSLALAWARNGIRVNGIAPGLVDTKLTKVTTEHKERLDATLKAIPLRRMGTPDEMAGAALFLTSSLASYVTGQTLIVDGGLTLA